MNHFWLSQFHSVKPKFSLSNELSIRNLIELRLLQQGNTSTRAAIEKRVVHFGSATSKIKTRSTEVKDYVLNLPEDREQRRFFKDGLVPGLDKRMALYHERGSEVLREFYPIGSWNHLRPRHLIHVSCTGYLAPSAPQEIVASWGLDQQAPTQVTHAYHMGCYAAFPALRIARGFLATLDSQYSNDTVDIVHTEMCSLHFDPSSLEAEQIVVQSLFADGHIKYSMSTRAVKEGLQVLSLREQIIPDSADLMTWVPSSTHFKMTLSREVQKAFLPYLNTFVDELLSAAQLKNNKDNSFIYAVHPGGPKIIDAVQEALALTEDQVEESKFVLENFGNMSSSTIPHIWKEIISNPKRVDGEIIIALAFGPGLTMSGGVFRLCKN